MQIKSNRSKTGLTVKRSYRLFIAGLTVLTVFLSACQKQVKVTSVSTEAIPVDASADAIQEMEEAGIHGKQCTPFLLAKVKDLTGGDSLAANIQLVLNNARLAAQTAKALCK